MNNSDNFTPPALFSIDWLSFTIYCDEREARHILSMWDLEDTLENSGHGGRGFRLIHKGLNGLQLKTQPTNQRKADDLSKEYDYNAVASWEDMDKLDREVRLDENREKSRRAITYCSIEMPGKCIAAIHPDDLLRVFNYIREKKYKINITRLDLAFDSQEYSNDAVWIALRRGKFKSDVKRENITRTHNLTKTGDTIYIGSRQSLQMLRIYVKMDKDSIFEDEPFTRMELELHDERATHALFSLLGLPPDQWTAFAAQLIAGFIEFNTPWWRKFIGSLEGVWLRLQRVASTIETVETWLYEQVAPSLAAYILANKKRLVSPDGVITDDLIHTFNDLLREGQGRLKKKHEVMINRYDPAAKTQYKVFARSTEDLINAFMADQKSSETE